MILVDTSVWIDHLRNGDATLVQLLENGAVLAHPFIIGELALGNLQQRQTILSALQELPQASIARDDEVLMFVEQNSLYGSGIGYIDTHLMTAVRLTPGATLWTRDKRLLVAAEKLGMAVAMEH